MAQLPNGTKRRNEYAKRTLQDLGFTAKQIEYLVGHAQQMYAPGDFDNEVQEHLDAFSAPRPTQIKRN